MKKLDEEPYLDSNMCNDRDDSYNQVDPLQLEARLLRKSTQLPLASISCKIRVDVEFVKQTVKMYKKLVKSNYDIIL